MRMRYVLAVWICIMGFASLSSAEIYRYRDANGVLRFTDNPAEIPENQLPESLQTYKKVEEFRPPEEAVAPQPTTASPNAAPSAGENTESEETAPSDALIEQRRSLSSEHVEITKLTQKLNSEKALAKPPAQRNEYNESVRLLNERISVYEQKRRVFEDNLKTFNEELNKVPSEPANTEAAAQTQENDIPLTVTQPSEPEEAEEEIAVAEDEEKPSDTKAAKTPEPRDDRAGKEKAAPSSESSDDNDESEAEPSESESKSSASGENAEEE